MRTTSQRCSHLPLDTVVGPVGGKAQGSLVAGPRFYYAMCAAHHSKGLQGWGDDTEAILKGFQGNNSGQLHFRGEPWDYLEIFATR